MSTQPTPPTFADILLGGGDMSRNKGEQQGWAQKTDGGKWKFFFRQYVSVEGKFEWKPTSRVVEEARTEAQCLRIGRERYLGTANAPAACAMGAATLSQYYETVFKPSRLPKMKPRSAKHFEWVMDHYILQALGELRLDSPQWPVMLQAVIDRLLERDNPLSPQSVTHIRNKVSAVFSHALKKKQYFGTNPARTVDLPRMTRKDRTVLTWEQVQMLLGSITGKTATLTDEYRLLVTFLMVTGLRIGEATNLRWRDINLTDGPVMSGSIALAPEMMIVRDSKTDAGIRAVPIIDALIPRLVAYRETHAFTDDDDFVFPNSKGGMLDAHNVGNRHLRPAGKKLGLGVVGWHTLRHSAATLAEQLGVSPATRQQILGHASARMTMHYTHGDIESVKTAYKGRVIQ